MRINISKYFNNFFVDNFINNVIEKYNEFDIVNDNFVHKNVNISSERHCKPI